jgi:hypothetical protein
LVVSFGDNDAAGEGIAKQRSHCLRHWRCRLANGDKLDMLIVAQVIPLPIHYEPMVSTFSPLPQGSTGFYGMQGSGEDTRNGCTPLCCIQRSSA